MKKFLYLILGLNVYLASNSQIYYTQGPDVYTCKGGIVRTEKPNRELNSSELANIEYSFFNPDGMFYYLGIKQSDILSQPSSYYNCHAYAWHLSEGNNTKVWINDINNNLSKYWDTELGCFVETTSSVEVDKIHYYRGDHSAIKSSDGKYISKWGRTYLIRHRPNQVPYPYSNDRKYYMKTLYISGSSTICNQSTYSIANFPQGASVQWSTSNDKLQLLSGQGTSTAVLKKNGHGSCEVKVTISAYGTNMKLEKAVWVGVPKSSNFKTRIIGSCYEPVTSVYTNVDMNITQWKVVHNGNAQYYSSFPDIDPESLGLSDGEATFVNVYAQNACGWSNYLRLFIKKPNLEDCGINILLAHNDSLDTPTYIEPAAREKTEIVLYPNPAKVSIAVDIQYIVSRNNALKLNNPTYQIQIWNDYNLIKTIHTKSLQTEIPISSLKTGYYYVVVIINGKKYKQQFFKQ